ncbi:MAG TPA: ATP-binding protein [Kofleriaceae bacterium]|nr:ATP-binding protein [Kofleriaceae bacterium]
MPAWLSFETKAKLGYASLAVLLAGGMAYAVHRLSEAADEQTARLRAEQDEITQVERLRWISELVVSSGRGYLLSGDPGLLARVQDARARFDDSVHAIASQNLSPRGSQLLAQVERAAGRFLQIQEQIMDALHRSEDTRSLVHRFDTEQLPLRRALDQALARLVDHKEATLAAYYDRARADRARLELWLYGLLGLLVLAGFGIARYFANLLGRSYRQGQQALEAARKALAARDELRGVVAHDLRNPLGSITMRAALLQREASSEKARRHAESIEKVTLRMELLIRTMLDVATMEAGRFSVLAGPCDVEDLLREAVELFEPLATSKQVRLEQRLGEPGLAVHADRERVLQVLSNLLGNALKFTPPGGRVLLAVDHQDGEVRFAVLDSGPGIPREHLTRVFERFWKDERGGKRGTGLGLFIARGIIDAHGGRIWAESDPGQGARLYFTLPLAPGTRVPAHSASRDAATA